MSFYCFSNTKHPRFRACWLHDFWGSKCHICGLLVFHKLRLYRLSEDRSVAQTTICYRISNRWNNDKKPFNFTFKSRNHYLANAEIVTTNLCQPHGVVFSVNHSNRLLVYINVYIISTILGHLRNNRLMSTKSPDYLIVHRSTPCTFSHESSILLVKIWSA